MIFTGSATHYTLTDLAAAAKLLSLDIAHLQAVMQVETQGASFDSQGRPTALFEPCQFIRYVSGDHRSQAIADKIACLHYGTLPYPDDSYPLIERAMTFNETGALMSTSWGCGQIMGENFHDAGYRNVTAMVTDAIASGGKQVAMFAAFLGAQGLAYDLRTQNWHAFALAYNGPRNVSIYSARLAAAYAKIAGPMRAAPAPDPVHDLTADDLNAQELAQGPNTTVG